MRSCDHWRISRKNRLTAVPIAIVISSINIRASVPRPLRMSGSILIVCSTLHVIKINSKCEMMLTNALCPIENMTFTPYYELIALEECSKTPVKWKHLISCFISLFEQVLLLLLLCHAETDMSMNSYRQSVILSKQPVLPRTITSFPGKYRRCSADVRP